MVAQSLANEDHVESDLTALEIIAGPVLLIAVFLGTLLIGIKAASPVELARRRQLEFTADASHELRTPLSVIEAEVSLSLSAARGWGRLPGHAGAGQRGEPRACATSSRTCCGCPGSTRSHLRPETNRWTSRPSPPLVPTVSMPWRTARGSPSQSRTGEDQPWINAPPEWIDRLTAVLVDNACRYAGPAGAVRIAVTAVGNRVSLVVDDSGPGIEPEERPQLFDRFHRATDEGNGAGLGLAIADSVVRATGGEWRVGQADLGGAHMEVRWHRSSGARDAGERTEPPEPEIVEHHPTGASVVG